MSGGEIGRLRGGGKRVTSHTLVDYHTPPPCSWLSRAKIEDWQDWHKLCVMLVDYAHPTAEVSYLSCKKVRGYLPECDSLEVLPV